MNDNLPAPGEPLEPEIGGDMDLGGLLGGLDLGALMGAASEMQQQFADAQERLAETVVEGSAGGGLVRVEITGDFTFQSVSISPEVIDPDDASMLEDLVLAALRDAASKASALAADATGMGDMGALGDIGKLFGG